MIIAKLLGRVPYPMAEAGTDGGGGDATTIDDADSVESEELDDDPDRGDAVDPPLDPQALKKIAGKEPEETDTKKGSAHVPIGRFNEVNEAKKALERKVADLEAKAAAPAPEAKPAPKEEPKFDEDKAERDYMTLLAEGEFDKAAAVRKQINANLREQVRAETEANVRSTLEQRDTSQTLTQVAQQAVSDFPFLDTEEGADVMELIIAARDGYAAKGTPLPKALKMAVDKIAPKYAPAQEADPGKESTKVDPGKDTRSTQANARGAGDSLKQPPKLEGGAGNRTTANKVAVEDLDDDQFDALSADEKRRLRGDEG